MNHKLIYPPEGRRAEVFPFRTRLSLWYGMYRVKFNLHSYNKEIRSRPMDVSM